MIHLKAMTKATTHDTLHARHQHGQSFVALAPHSARPDGGSVQGVAPLDMLIATHALSESAVLVTNDQAFWQMTGLKIEDWTV